MDKHEQRRSDLRRLVDSFGRGGIARVAAKIGKDPSYVSRMLYSPEKDGHKKIGEDSAEDLEREFPGWQTTENCTKNQPPAQAEQGLAATKTVTDLASRRTSDGVDNALRVLAEAIDRLAIDNRDGVAGLLSSFGRNPGAPGTYTALLALLDSGNARRQADPPVKYSISAGR